MGRLRKLFHHEQTSGLLMIAAALALLNVFCITRSAAYVTVGLILWVAMLKAGIEAALVGGP